MLDTGRESVRGSSLIPVGVEGQLAGELEQVSGSDTDRFGLLAVAQCIVQRGELRPHNGVHRVFGRGEPIHLPQVLVHALEALGIGRPTQALLGRGQGGNRT
ncbi:MULTISPECIES: hypothetical protein [Streptomyces]|uniref:Uncharacterized protein n=1 Tax=Streptomyces thermoviolaceus subsp. thermoviolaceus TaxID=66860 RepID=A0ABX0YUR3_STRTL|nr:MULTISPECIES: hypothetical protein [Streptomyces]NJP16316.1 hypothetical protein [Streptomyces thermoviolaceus subsp. thermoviolaceus]GGV81849.1 hypothetical protein GCM10010499_46810 [Streptomyces thermoviolaceus subsp. apingens]